MDPQPLWLWIGFAGQGLFSARFIVQWLASERRRRSVVPVAFWFLSLTGGMVLLLYAIHRRDPVFMVGQAAGIFIYSRNLWLIYHRPTDEAGDATPVEATGEAPGDPSHGLDQAS